MQLLRFGIACLLRQYGLLVSAFGLAGGAAIYFLLPFEPDLFGVLIGLTGLVMARLAFLLIHANACISRACLAVLTALAIGILSGKLATLRAASPALPELKEPVLLEGWVEAIDTGAKGPRLRLLVHAVSGYDRAIFPDHVRVTHRLSRHVDVGRFVRCWVVLRPPPVPLMDHDYAFDRHAFFHQIGGVGYVRGRCRPGTLGPPRDTFQRLRLRLAELRRALARRVKTGAGPRAGGFAAALASGDRSFLALSDQAALRGSGLAHLMAISGLHMGLVGGLVFLCAWRGLALIEPLALRLTVRKPAALIAILACTFYLLMSGASVSTQRAFIMAMVVFGAVLVDRAPFSLQSFALAMILVTLLAPWSVLSPGFQMSFAATGALIATFNVWGRHRKKQGLRLRGAVFWRTSMALTSLVSGLATMPFGIYHFGRVAVLGLPANLAAMPIVSLLCTPLAGLAVLFSWFGQADLGLALFGWSLEPILAIANVFSRSDGTGSELLKPLPGVALFMMVSGLVLASSAQGRWRLLGLGPLLFAVTLWVKAPAVFLHWAPSGDLVLTGGPGGPKRYAFANGDGLVPMRYRDVPVSDLCAGPSCVLEIDRFTVCLIRDPIQTCPQPASLSLSLADSAPSDDPTSVNWTDVQIRNGLTWRFDKSEPRLITGPGCGQRPWRRCR